ncbi:MAG: tol-pal system-associated acyl-CoA thioesterase [Hyphomicrobiales bacterium]|nr:MAG: tol-pal system-associated acyl-CoA thioesterase [Hyphomicrobiales bacterium]
MSADGVPDEWPDLAGRIENGRHVLAVRVYYEDTDFSGVVYHSNYLKFMERGRSDFLRLLGVHHNELADGDGPPAVAFVVRHMEIDFRAPARIDDVLTVTTWSREIRGARFFIDQTVSRGGDILIAAAVTAAAIDARGRPVRLPAELRARLEKPSNPGPNP